MDKILFKNEITKILKITREYDAEKVILFGSCLDSVESARDIDIAVKGVNPELFFNMYGRILSEVSCEIDVVPLEYVREHFCERVLEKGHILYGKKI